MTSLLCQEDARLSLCLCYSSTAVTDQSDGWLNDAIDYLCHLVPVSSLQPGRSENGVPTNDIAEDEDLLNVALWQRGSTTHR